MTRNGDDGEGPWGRSTGRGQVVIAFVGGESDKLLEDSVSALGMTD